MFNTGLLILTRPLPVLRGSISPLLSEVSKVVGSTLYVHIQPNSSCDAKDFQIARTPYTSELRTLMTELYTSSATICKHLNIQILLAHISNKPSFPWDTGYRIKPACDIVLFDDHHWLVKEDIVRTRLLENLTKKFQPDCQTMPSIDVVNTDIFQSQDNGNLNGEENQTESTGSSIIDSYRNTVLGGTFDHLHIGHKILLGEGCLLADKRLTVGVTDGEMNNKKTLPELIQPLSDRLESVRNHIQEIRPNITPDVVPIYDAFGPTITDPDLQCIILSQETRKGGQMVNNERLKKGFPLLEEYVIELVEDRQHSQYEEHKISSSSLRKRLLGTLIKSPQEKSSIPSAPYVIGVTGGIASGKSALCQRLEGLGAVSIDCDKLGHQVYVKDTPCFDLLVDKFGTEIVGTDGEVDRKVLGPIVFRDPDKLKMLNSIVWPEITKLAEERIQQHRSEGKQIVVLEAALLLEAGWDSLVHEVWTAIIPRPEAIKRMVERNRLTEEEATKRLDSQMTNQDRVSKSNVILCTQWEYDYTQSQVEKAWSLLTDRLAGQNKVESHL